MAKKTKDPSEKLGFGNLLAWNSRMVSTSIMVLLMGFLMAYCTDTLGITPAYVSIILVASKLLDGVTDAFAGFIVDRTKTKWGKARPYELYIILLWVATWLMFSCTSSGSGLCACVTSAAGVSEPDTSMDISSRPGTSPLGDTAALTVSCSI